MPQHEYMEVHKKRHGERMDRAEKRYRGVGDWRLCREGWAYTGAAVVYSERAQGLKMCTIVCEQAYLS